MKATLEFDLNDHDQRMEHMRCIKATDMALALWDIQVGNFRKRILNELEVMDITQPGTLDNILALDGAYFVLDKLTELLDQHNIDVQDLIN